MRFEPETIPLWGVFCITLAAVFISIWIGTILGRLRSRRPGHEDFASLGTINAAILGLLAFLLAFTFQITAQVFQSRRELLLDEVNAIGTTYLRAQMLPEPQGSEIRKLLREYVDLRANLARAGGQDLMTKLKESVLHSEALQDRMWSHAAAVAGNGRGSVIDALFISSLNEMIDLQTSRLTVFTYRIPPVIWLSLGFITILSMLMIGYQVGLSNKRITEISIILACTFSMVILLIADLDRASEGSLRVGQQPMFELHEKMQMSMQEKNL